MVVDPFCSIFIPISGLFSGDVIIQAEPDSGTDFESGFRWLDTIFVITSVPFLVMEYSFPHAM